MNTIDAIINAQISVSMVVGMMVKLFMILLLILSVVMVRQAGLMNKVIKLPVGGSVRLLTWSYFLFTALLTAIVILA